MNLNAVNEHCNILILMAGKGFDITLESLKRKISLTGIWDISLSFPSA
jgi:hypothetical protein